MTIVVTGAKGQVGRELMRLGKHSGLRMLGVDIEDVDISDRASVDHFFDGMGMDFLVNAAAFTAVDAAETDMQAAFAVNREGPANLAMLCAKKSIPLIHISTDYVYDGTKTNAYIETDPVSPVGVYARSKAQGDAEVARRSEAHIILRTAWLYSVHGHNFVKTMLNLFRKERTVSVVDDQYGCPTHAADLADAILRIIAQTQKKPAAAWGIYHYAGQGTTSWYGFAKKVLALAASYDHFSLQQLTPIPTSEYPRPAQRPHNSVLDCNKIQRAFGIQTVPWEKSLEEMLERLYQGAP